MGLIDSLNPIGAAIGGAGDIAKMLYGFGQILSGNKHLKNLKVPTYNIPSAYNQNVDLAGQIASQGLPDSTKNYYSDQIQRGLGSTINAAEATGQGLGDITKSYSASNDAFQQLLAADAQQKQANQGILMNARKDLAQQQLQKQDWEQFIPYEQAYNRFTNQTNAGATNLFGGTQDLGALGSLFGKNSSNTGTGYGFTVPGSQDYSAANGGFNSGLMQLISQMLGGH